MLHYSLSASFLKLKPNKATKDISLTHDSGIVKFIGFITSLVTPKFLPWLLRHNL